MDFRERLESICATCEGAVAATLMGSDGIPVDSVETGEWGGEEPIDVGAMLVEYNTVLEQVRRTGETLAAGEMTELSIRSERLVTVIRPVSAEYFLAVALRPSGNTGKARYLLRIHAPRLLPELS